MKKHLFHFIALLFLMSSCLEEPEIYLLLPEEDAIIIPYKVGDQMLMVNQDGDTIHFIVTYDETEVYGGSGYDDFIFADDTKFDPEPGPWCYGRRVQLRSYADGIRMVFIALPNQTLYFDIWSHDVWSQVRRSIECHLRGETQDFTIGDITYENVYYRQEANPLTGDLIQWYYSKENGLLAIKYKDLSLTRIP